MKTRSLPTLEYLRARLEYRDGQLFWKERPSSDFSSDRIANAVNSRFVGTRAGCPMANGYRLVAVGGVKFLEHRLIYQMMVAPLRDGASVDHIDQDFTNNRPENLRACSHAQNLMNQPGRRSGMPKHVYWSKRERKYKVSLRANGQRYFLGTFATLEAAASVAAAARARFHGSFADDRSAA